MYPDRMVPVSYSVPVSDICQYLVRLLEGAWDATRCSQGKRPSMSPSDLEARKASSASIREKHPDRVPVIVEKRAGDRALPDIDKKKFLVPADLSVGQFMYVIRKRIKLSPEQAIFLFVAQGTLPPSVSTLQSVYDQHKDEDGFLYMTYSGENFFGEESATR